MTHRDPTTIELTADLSIMTNAIKLIIRPTYTATNNKLQI